MAALNIPGVSYATPTFQGGGGLAALAGQGGSPPAYTIDPATGNYVLASGHSVSPAMYAATFGAQPSASDQWNAAFTNMANPGAAPITATGAGSAATPGGASLASLLTGNPMATGGQLSPLGTSTAQGMPGTAAAGATAPGLATAPAPIPMPTSGQGFDLNPAAYLNPQEQFLQDWGAHDLGSLYGSQGQLLSGNALRGITQYGQNLAQASSWAPALAAAQQQQQTGIGLGEFNQQFQNQLGLENQTIPFQQQLQLAQLGLTGAQGQSAINQMLAAILSQNAIAAGQAAGTGTIGQSNAITQAIQQAISGSLGANLASNFASLFNRPIATPG